MPHKDPVKAFAYAEMAASRGHPRGLTMLGLCFEQGAYPSIQLDTISANVIHASLISLTPPALPLSTLIAHHTVCHASSTGVGVGKDASRARSLYERACALPGDTVDAMYQFGSCLYGGGYYPRVDTAHHASYDVCTCPAYMVRHRRCG